MAPGGMAARPAKRQKRLTVLSSSDDDLGAGQNGALRQASRKTSNGREPTTPRKISDVALVLPSRSPSKRKAAAAVKISPSRKNGKQENESSKQRGKGSLYTFFTSSTQQQQQPATSAQRQITPVTVEEVGEEEDLIQDDSFDDELFDAAMTDVTALNGSTESSQARSTVGSKFPATQKFVKPSKSGVALTTPSVATEALRSERRPWAEEYAPINMDELAVHKNKVADVRKWLENVMRGRDKKVGALRLLGYIQKWSCGPLLYFLCHSRQSISHKGPVAQAAHPPSSDMSSPI
jgi:cell cycle checkpoint protein